MQYHAAEDLGFVVVTCTDTVMAQSAQVFLTYDQFERFKAWRSGAMLIQDALPDLADSEREIILTGMDDEAWNAMCDETEDEEVEFDEAAF